jgi:hypothetical protein
MQVLATALAAAGLLGPAGASIPAPAIAIPPGPLVPGAPVEVTLSGFPAGIVNLELCGGAAHRGSPDCALGAGRSVLVTGADPVRGELPVAIPPVPCPCVIRAIGAAGTRALLPVRVVGVPDAPVAPARPAQLVVAATAAGPGWRDWSLVAGPTRVRVRAVVTNRGGRRAEAGGLTVALARAGAAPLVTATRRLGPLPPGARRIVEADLSVPAPAWGSYRATVAVTSGPTAHTRVEVTPWGVPALLGAAVAGFAAVLWRRRAFPPSPPPVVPSPGP